MMHWRQRLPLYWQWGPGVPPVWTRTSAFPSGALPVVTVTEKRDTEKNIIWARNMTIQNHATRIKKVCVERGADAREKDFNIITIV